MCDKTLLDILKIWSKKGDKKGYFCQICGDFFPESSGHPANELESNYIAFIFKTGHTLDKNKRFRINLIRSL